MKKQPLVTNQRDKNLLLFLGVVIIVFLFFNYLISPALENGAALKAEVDQADMELVNAEDTILQYPEFKKEEPEVRKTVSDKYNMFFHDVNQERILYKLDTLIANSGLSIASYSNSGTSALPITFSVPEFNPVTYPLQGVALRANPALAELLPPTTPAMAPASEELILTTDITINFDSSYNTAMAFLKSVEDLDKSVIVRSISLSKTETGIDGQIILAFYSLPQIDSSKKDPMEFKPTIPQGKVDPFI